MSGTIKTIRNVTSKTMGNRCISAQECNAIMQECDGTMLDAVYMAFRLGFARGMSKANSEKERGQ